ncbi:hypothetical protein AVEN_179369-1, partial [Araneus ventricosus]
MTILTSFGKGRSVTGNGHHDSDLNMRAVAAISLQFSPGSLTEQGYLELHLPYQILLPHRGHHEYVDEKSPD